MEEERHMEEAGCFTPGQRIEVWLAGYDQWLGGEVESAGFLGGVACVRVKLRRSSATWPFFRRLAVCPGSAASRRLPATTRPSPATCWIRRKLSD